MITIVQIVAGTTLENYQYNTAFLPCFLSFLGDLSKTRLTNDSGVIVIAIAVT